MPDIAAKWKAHNLLRRRPWMLPVGVVALIAAHVIVVRYALPRAALSVAVVSGVVIVVVLKHVGLLGSLFALFRRPSRHN
jgi:hypothetical protein